MKNFLVTLKGKGTTERTVPIQAKDEAEAVAWGCKQAEVLGWKNPAVKAKEVVETKAEEKPAKPAARVKKKKPAELAC